MCKKTKNWLINAFKVSPYDDISIILRLAKAYEDIDEEANIDENKHNEKLQSRIEQLETFITFSQEIHSLLIGQINSVDGNSAININRED